MLLGSAILPRALQVASLSRDQSAPLLIHHACPPQLGRLRPSVRQLSNPATIEQVPCHLPSSAELTLRCHLAVFELERLLAEAPPASEAPSASEAEDGANARPRASF